MYNFSAPSEFRGVDPSGCANCIRQQENHELSTGQCILTDYLIEHIQKDVVSRGLQLRSLEKDEVVQYLKANLHWRVTDVSFLDSGVRKDNGKLRRKKSP